MSILEYFFYFSLCIFQIGTGSCSGDSGGPLVFNDKLSKPSHYVQVGIVQGSAGECGNERFPGIYVRLDDYDVLSFIYKTAFGKTLDSSISSPAGKFFYLERSRIDSGPSIPQIFT